MTYQTPCSSPENDPDDWYIGKDGRQYPDDPTPTLDDAIAQLDQVDPHGTRYEGLIVETQERLEIEQTRANLRRRRHAKDACFVDCLVRTQCLDRALSQGERHGTWGGYYEEELRAIRDEMARRKAARAAARER